MHQPHFLARIMTMGAFLFLICLFVAADLTTAKPRLSHRKLKKAKDPSEAIHDQYIVLYKPSAREGDIEARLHGCLDSYATVVSDYDSSSVRGITVSGVSEDALKALLDDDEVELVEEDQMMYAAGTQLNPPTWGLDRIDQPNAKLDDAYTYDAMGSGVTVYVFDSGVRASHEDFGGRASCGFDAIDKDGDCRDDYGHGTHVSGTVGGTMYGAAKNATIVAVKVLDEKGGGPLSGVVEGLNYVRRQKEADPSKPIIVNMSLAGRSSKALNLIVDDMVDSGIPIVVAAGNSFFPACMYSPASAKGTIAVGSTTPTDYRSLFSNWGSCVAIFAPGSDIKSASAKSDTASKILSGTSMSSPFVAGAMALLLEKEPGLSPSALLAKLLSTSSKGVKFRLFGSPNAILQI